ncbi:DUF4249 family protein [Bacteroidota bacterium]
MMKKIILFLYIIFLFSACEEDTTVIPYVEILIVEGYLYEGEPVENIKLSKLIPITGDLGEDYSVNDATVEIIMNGESYSLELSPGDSGYYHYPNNDLIIEEGEKFELLIEYNDEFVSAETIVPQPPDSMRLSLEEVKVEPIYERWDMRNREVEDVLLEWHNPDASYYYVVIENTEVDPDNVDVNGIMEDFKGKIRFMMITEPTQDDFYLFRGMMLEQYGTHKVTLYKVNKEYADLYETSGQDSRDLNEPLNNIHNGLGIFTSFNSDVLYFEVVKP